jgi:ubiquinone/menaquinone biosynthesis C-methylase UbiE
VAHADLLPPAAVALIQSSGRVLTIGAILRFGELPCGSRWKSAQRCHYNYREAANRLISGVEDPVQVRQVSHTFLESAELYDAIYSYKDYARESARLRDLIDAQVPSGRRILDVACGTGEHAKFLKEHYAIDGIDINESYLRAARRKNPAGSYVRADMLAFDLGRTYDGVTCLFSAIGILKTFNQLATAISCMARHVKPDGVLIIEPWFTPDQWRSCPPFVLSGEIRGGKVYRLSHRAREEHMSVLLNHYLRPTSDGLEHYNERIELGLFSRDEMIWAFEFAGMAVCYDSDGLMGRGLYIGRSDSAFRPLLGNSEESSINRSRRAR